MGQPAQPLDSSIENQPGVTSPQDPAPEPNTDPGKFYENMREELKQALRDLKNGYKFEDMAARRDEVKKIRKAREFWKGVQNIWWSETDQAWRLPFDGVPDKDVTEDDFPRYDFVTNIYQAFGASIIAVLSQSVPHTQFMPQDAETPEDVATAKAASDITSLVERNNKFLDLLLDLAFYLWTDGKAAGYVRYVVDGQRFGFQEQPNLVEETAMMGEPLMVCDECGESFPPAAEPAPGEEPGIESCPTCGSYKLQRQEPTETSIPRENGKSEIPNGQEVIDIISGLELKTPIWCKSQNAFPYLIWETEAHIAQLRATYPHLSEKVTPTSAGSGDEYERQARLRLAYGGVEAETGGVAPGDHLITFERVWLRPWAFYLLENGAVRDELLKLFPKGVYCAFAGDNYCEARPENMDDHWQTIQAFPGDGQNRPAIGTSLISIQERLNTCENLATETLEYGIPATYVDSEAIDFDGLQEQTAEPGAFYPLTLPPGKSAGDVMFQPQPAALSPIAMEMMERLMGPVAQFITGSFPALWGGSMENVDTAAAYAQAKDQAMGRLGIFYRAMKNWKSQIDIKSVEVFRRNRKEDVKVAVIGRGNEFENKVIQIADLRGSIQAHPDTEEQFPTLWTQQRAVLMQLMESGDEMVGKIFSDPTNLPKIKSLIGLPDLVIPDENSRNKQFREIAELMAEEPQEVPGPLDPMTGQPGPSEFRSTVPVDRFADNHAVELQICKDWINGAEGQEAKRQMSAGYLNVRAHAMEHQAVILEMAMAQSENPQVAAASTSSKAEIQEGS